MHPASTTAASGGLSAALVVIVMWFLSLVHIDMPADVAAAFGVVATAAIGYIMHGKIAASLLPPPPADPVAPAAPAPEAPHA